MNLTSKERIIRTLCGESTDCVPVSFYGVDPDDPKTWRIQESSYLRYVEATRGSDLMPWVGNRVENGFLYGIPTNALLQYSKGRVEDGEVAYTKLQYGKSILTSAYKQKKYMGTQWQIEPLLKSEKDIKVLQAIKFDFVEPDLSELHTQIKSLGDRGMSVIPVGSPLVTLRHLFSYEMFSILCFTKTKLMRELLDSICERLVHFCKYIGEQVTDVIIRLGGCEQATAPLMKPAMFKELVLDYDKAIIEAIKQTGNFGVLHCHGKLSGVLDMIALIGPNGLEPVEPPPGGDLTLFELKQRIGNKMCLMGYIQFHDLETRSTEEIDRLVAEAMAVGKLGGRFMLLPSDGPISFVSEQSLENHKQMLISGRKYGVYLG